MNKAQSLRILIAEDNALLRLGLRLVLERASFVVAGEAVNGEEAVRLAAELQPDLIILDLNMPVMNGITAAQVIHSTDNPAKIIMFTSSENEENIFASLGAGVNGYCLKDTSVDRLIAGIRIVWNGDFWLDSNIAAKVMRSLPTLISGTGKPVTTEAGSHSQKQLSREELDILHAIVEGLTIPEIAQRHSTSEQAVRDVEISMLGKLAAANGVQNALRTLKGDEDGGVQQTVKPKLIQSEDRMVNTTFADRYEIISRLGSGGMSIVYKARQIFLNRIVALKVLNSSLVSDLKNARRFREEAEAASLMNHPNVIKVFDFGLSSTGEAYLAMDYLQGQNLNDVIEESGPLSVERALTIFIQVCAGLGELHRHGIVHRDLKPGNIMLIERDGADHVCLIDLGIAKSLNPGMRSELTGDGQILGSPSYLSPEQAQGLHLDGRSDIYSLGCTMYETLCGVLPFSANFPWETMLQHVTDRPVPLSKKAPELHIPELLDELVMRTLEKNPCNRYQNVAELQAQLMSIKATTLALSKAAALQPYS